MTEIYSFLKYKITVQFPPPPQLTDNSTVPQNPRYVDWRVYLSPYNISCWEKKMLYLTTLQTAKFI